MINEMMGGLKERFLKWRSALERKGLKMNFEKKKVMVCGSESGVIRSRIDLCGIYCQFSVIYKMCPMDS